VREHSVAKVPNLFVVGAREAEEKTVAIRRLGSKAQDVEKLDEAVVALVEAAKRHVNDFTIHAYYDR